MAPAYSITCILGPTASGKSAVAMAFAERLRVAGYAPVILACDSQQIYRGADIGTNKPTEEDRAKVRHGGIDLVEIGQKFDVALYLKSADEFINTLADPKNHLILVGGTGLYYRALKCGLAEIPPVPEELRRDVSARSLADLQASLKKADPHITLQIDMQNRRRVARALEVVLATGESLLAWQQRKHTSPVLSSSQTRAYVLIRDREDLAKRIEQRTAEMLAGGWIEETRALLERYGCENLQRARFPAIGYPELADWLQNGGDLKTVEQQIIRSTRQYAKRQLTWFRRESNVEFVSLKSGRHFFCREAGTAPRHDSPLRPSARFLLSSSASPVQIAEALTGDHFED